MTRREFLQQFSQMLLLVCATYNPTGWCYLVWIDNQPDLPASVVLVFGAVLVACYIYSFRAAIASLGMWNLVFLFVFLWGVLWMLADLHLIQFTSHEVGLQWAAIFILSLTLAVGKEWPKLRKGQILRVQTRKRKTQTNSDWLEGDWGVKKPKRPPEE